MLVWLLQTGEPLHIDSGNPRPMRAMNLSNKLVQAGHKVVLWTSAFSHQGKFHRFKQFKVIKFSENLEIRLIPSCGYQRHIGLSRLFDHAQLGWNLRHYLKDTTALPDVAFVGYPPIETAYVFANWLKSKNIPFVLDVKDLWPTMFVDALPKIVRPIARIVFHPYYYQAKITINNATSISSMAPSFLQWVLDFANKKDNGNNKVFPLTSPSGQISKQEVIEAQKWWLDQGIDGKIPVVFFAGSFMSVFDFDPVVQAVKKLSNLPCKFVLCGAGDYLSEVKNKFSGLKNVIFPGWIDRPKIESLAQYSIAALIPYKNIDNYIINTPNKVVDSMSLGLPILSPLSGEVSNLIQKYQIGFKYQDGRELAQSIELLVTDFELKKTMSKKAKALYQDKFEFNLVYDQFVKHLATMATKPLR